MVGIVGEVLGIVGEELCWWGLLVRSWGGGDCW